MRIIMQRGCENNCYHNKGNKSRKQLNVNIYLNLITQKDCERTAICILIIIKLLKEFNIMMKTQNRKIKWNWKFHQFKLWYLSYLSNLIFSTNYSKIYPKICLCKSKLSLNNILISKLSNFYIGNKYGFY